MTKKDKVEEQVEGQVEEQAVEKVEVPKVEIIRGRMPLPIVALIKFSPADETDAALAGKFRTTNGKISDIRKERNFGYIDKEYVPSQEQLDKAKIYAAELADKSVLEKLNKMKAATDEQNASFESKRAAVRKNAAPKSSAPAEVSETNATVGTDVSDAALNNLTE